MSSFDYLTPEILVRGLLTSSKSYEQMQYILKRYLENGLVSDVQLKDLIINDSSVRHVLSGLSCELRMNIMDIISPVLDTNETMFLLNSTSYSSYTNCQIFSNYFINNMMRLVPPGQYIDQITIYFYLYSFADPTLVHNYLAYFSLNDLLIDDIAYSPYYDVIIEHILSREDEISTLKENDFMNVCYQLQQVRAKKSDLKERYIDFLKNIIRQQFCQTDKMLLNLIDKRWKTISSNGALADVAIDLITNVHEEIYGKITFGRYTDTICLLFVFLIQSNGASERSINQFIFERLHSDLSELIEHRFSVFILNEMYNKTYEISTRPKLFEDIPYVEINELLDCCFAHPTFNDYYMN